MLNHFPSVQHSRCHWSAVYLWHFLWEQPQCLPGETVWKCVLFPCFYIVSHHLNLSNGWLFTWTLSLVLKSGVNTSYKPVLTDHIWAFIVQNTVNEIPFHPVKAFSLKGVTTGVVKLPPASGSSPIYRLCGEIKKRQVLCFLCDFILVFVCDWNTYLCSHFSMWSVACRKSQLRLNMHFFLLLLLLILLFYYYFSQHCSFVHRFSKATTGLFLFHKLKLILILDDTFQQLPFSHSLFIVFIWEPKEKV